MLLVGLEALYKTGKHETATTATKWRLQPKVSASLEECDKRTVNTYVNPIVYLPQILKFHDKNVCVIIAGFVHERALTN